MKKSAMITEISLEDFLKLNLVGYKYRKNYFNKDGKEVGVSEIGEFVTDSKGDRHWVTFEGITSRLTWDKVNLNEVVLENVEWSNAEQFKNRCICLAIHTEPSEEEIHEIMNEFNYVKLYREGNGSLTKITHEEAYEQLLFKYSYLDKWLTPSGIQTYLIRCDVPHLYSEKRKFCTHDDYFDVPKSKTKAVYLIKY